MTEPGIYSYRDLHVWQKAIALSVACYRLTAEFPKDELYGIAAQIRRSSAPIPANIAEGHGREHTRSFVQFLRVAQGSLKELETHLFLAEQVGLVESSSLVPRFAASEEIGRMLRSLINKLQAKLGEFE